MAALNTNTIAFDEPELMDPWPGAAGPAAIFDQKVWDTGGGGRWCYYSLATINPTPLAAQTTPNWSGAISNSIVVGVR